MSHLWSAPTGSSRSRSWLVALRRPGVGLPRVQWAMLLAALGAGAVAVAGAAVQPSPLTLLGVPATAAWMALLLAAHLRPALLGWRTDAVEAGLLVAVAAGIGLEQSLGVFYTALYFRAAHHSRARLFAGVAVYFTALATGSLLAGGLTDSETTLLGMQAMGLCFTAFPMSVVLGSLLARGQELTRERQLLEAVLDSLDVAVVACDAQGRPRHDNAAARAAGLSAALLFTGRDGDRDVRTVDGTTASPVEQLPVHQVAAHGHVHEHELSVSAPDLPIRQYLVNARSVVGDEDHGLLVVAALHDVTERRRAAEQLERQALHDALTGLPNRLLLRDRLEHALQSADRRAAPPALLFLDLDGFKAVNDSSGHEAGDQVLVTIADRLRSCMRPDDTLARLGGDEFAVLLEDSSLPEALDVADRLIAVARAPVTAAGTEFTVGASIGVAAPHLDDLRAGGVQASDLLRNADLAMYEAKAAGKGRVEVFASQMHEALVARLTMERDLRAALDQGELELHYQPVVSMSTRRRVGAEALLRWNSPHRGLVSPADFVPLAEATGLIVPIGAWVLRQACQQAAAWRAGGDPELSDMHVAVNVSVHQLHDPGLAATVSGALVSSGLPADRLVLEITESAFSDIEKTLPRLHALRALGVQLAIDDFGTGYSSLTRLQMFPVDTVKIDRSFVSTIRTGGPAPLVTATLALARAFGLSTVGEGIETELQESFLREQGCDLAQGYRYARPLPAAEFVRGPERVAAVHPQRTGPASVSPGPAAAAAGSAAHG